MDDDLCFGLCQYSPRLGQRFRELAQGSFADVQRTVLVCVVVQPTLGTLKASLRLSDALASTPIARLRRVVFFDQLHVDTRVVGLVFDVVEEAGERHLVGLVVDVPAFVVVLANPTEVAHDDERVPFFGILHDVPSNLVETVVHLPCFRVTDTLDHLLSLSWFGVPDGLAELLVVFADTAHFLSVEGGLAVREERTGCDPPYAHVDSQHVVVLVGHGHRPLHDEMDVPITVTAHQFAVPNIALADELFVLSWDVGRTPDGVAPSTLGVVDGDFDPPRRENGILVVGHVEHVVAKDDGLFGVWVRVFLSLDFRRLLVGRRIQVGISAVYLGLERLVLTGEQVGFPVGQRVEFDPHRG